AAGNRRTSSWTRLPSAATCASRAAARPPPPPTARRRERPRRSPPPASSAIPGRVDVDRRREVGHQVRVAAVDAEDRQKRAHGVRRLADRDDLRELIEAPGERLRWKRVERDAHRLPDAERRDIRLIDLRANAHG